MTTLHGYVDGRIERMAQRERELLQRLWNAEHERNKLAQQLGEERKLVRQLKSALGGKE